tara:strand:- start:1932 stop:3041 length:1110 start_codon:yes stop_codon:yes gene_type:complete
MSSDRILKPDSGNDLVLQNDDASAKIEINEDGTNVVSSKLKINTGSTNNTNTATDGLEIANNAGTSSAHIGIKFDQDSSSGDFEGFVRAVRTAGTTFIGLEIGTISNHGIRFLTSGGTDSDVAIEISASGNLEVKSGSQIIIASGATLDTSSGTLTTSTAQKEAIVQAGPGSGTLDVSSGTFTTSTAQKQAIVSGAGTTEVKGLVPVGAIFQMAFTPGSTWLSTNRFLICDGSSLNSSTDTQYADLYSTIGTTWGGSSASAFNVPDLKGAYLRGVGTSTVFTQDQTITLAQTLSDQFQDHQHRIRNRGGGSGSADGIEVTLQDNSGVSEIDQNIGATDNGYAERNSNGIPRSGNETRPNSRGVQFIIKF